MPRPEQNAQHKAFLRKAAEQLEGVAKRIGEPFRAAAWNEGDEATLAIWREGEDDPVLRIMAWFDDEGAERKGFNACLKLIAEWEGEATEMLVLGWRDSVPNFNRGLDGPTDHAEGDYADAMGRLVQRIRSDAITALKSLGASLTQARALTVRAENRVIDADSQGAALVRRIERPPDAGERHSGALSSRAGAPDIGLLQSIRSH